MEFQAQAAIARAIKSYGRRHRAKRVSVWVRDSQCGATNEDESSATSTCFRSLCSWSAPDTNLSALSSGQVRGFQDERWLNLLSDDENDDENTQQQQQQQQVQRRNGTTANDADSQVRGYWKNDEQEKGHIVSLYTPLISHLDKTLVLGVLLTELSDDRQSCDIPKKQQTPKNDTDTTDSPKGKEAEPEQEDNDQDDEKECVRNVAAVAAELVSAILVSSPRWGVQSQPMDLGSQFKIDVPLRLFMDLFETYRMKPTHDEWERIGRAKFEKQVAAYMSAHLPVPMVLPSFPFKSSNTTHKVISRDADMAEKLALNALKDFCEKVRGFYPPGARVVIVSDGRVYSSQFEIELPHVLRFQRQIRELNESPDVSFIGLGDFLPVTPEANKRDSLLLLCGQNMDRIDKLLREDADFNRVYCGFKRFMGEELSFPADSTGKQRRARCAAAAKEMMKSNDAYGRLVKCMFPNHIRLSIHAHSNVHKVGIALVRMSDVTDIQWGTPWHNCAVLRTSGDWELIRKNVATKRGYKLQHTEQGLPYYLERDAPQPTTPEGEVHAEAKQPVPEPDATSKIFVGNLPAATTDTEIREYFSVAGGILEVEHIKNGSRKRPVRAYVTFCEEREAVWAIENLNGVAWSNEAGAPIVRVERVTKREQAQSSSK